MAQPKLTMNTNVQQGIDAILQGIASPYIDFDGIRYIISVERWFFGTIVYTEFDLLTQTIIGDSSYAMPYANHHFFRELLFGPNAKNRKEKPIVTAFPVFPTPNNNGSVIP